MGIVEQTSLQEKPDLSESMRSGHLNEGLSLNRRVFTLETEIAIRDELPRGGRLDEYLVAGIKGFRPSKA